MDAQAPVRRRSRLAGAALLAAALLAATSGPAAAAVHVDPGPPPRGMTGGADVSWPQCPTSAGGWGNPMPHDSASFVVIGLSRGSAFTTNPCLADEVAWARTHHAYVAAYVVPTYPTNAEYARYGTRGPYPRRTVAGRLMNVGWAQAAYWVRVARATRIMGVVTPMIWVDVEQRATLLRWTARPADRNLPVLRGLLAGLAGAGYRTGVYTPTAGWRDITGGARLGLPEWRTVGESTAAAALAQCSAPPVEGGPVLITQYYTRLPAQNRDYDVMCPITRRNGRLARYFARY